MFHITLNKKIISVLRRFTLPVFFLLVIIICSPESIEAQTPKVNWEELARLKPDLRVMVRIVGSNPLSLEDLASLTRAGLNPADRDPALVLGRKEAIFSIKLKHWNPIALPGHLKGTLLDRFLMTGIYRLSFKVEQQGYEGPLTLEITAPRDGFGQRLLASENMVRPRGPQHLKVDEAGNRWFCVDYPKVMYGETISFQFAFKYLVEMSSLLGHDLMLLEQSSPGPIPVEIQRYLASGHKIDTENPQVLHWVNQESLSGPLNIRSEYLKVKKFIKKTVSYDNVKKNNYFGGKAVYSNLDDMYQDIPTTLYKKYGACPDTSTLECALLRAKGIPCRTAGRFGHFLTHLYVSGKGWFSTLIHPTGIPLLVAPGPDNVAYHKWRPNLQLKTVILESKIRIDLPEESL